MGNRMPEDDPEALRRLLRRYQVPAAPADLEPTLRAAFRRRGRRRPPAAWIAAAAVVAAAVVIVAFGMKGPRSSVPRVESRLAVPIEPAARPTPGPSAPRPRPRATASNAPRHAAVSPAPAASGVVVEPGQKELLLLLARRLRRVQVGPLAPPTTRAADAPGTAPANPPDATGWQVERVEVSRIHIQPAAEERPGGF